MEVWEAARVDLADSVEGAVILARLGLVPEDLE